MTNPPPAAPTPTDRRRISLPSKTSACPGSSQGAASINRLKAKWLDMRPQIIAHGWPNCELGGDEPLALPGARPALQET